MYLTFRYNRTAENWKTMRLICGFVVAMATVLSIQLVTCDEDMTWGMNTSVKMYPGMPIEDFREHVRYCVVFVLTQEQILIPEKIHYGNKKTLGILFQRFLPFKRSGYTITIYHRHRNGGRMCLWLFICLVLFGQCTVCITTAICLRKCPQIQSQNTMSILQERGG